MAEPARRALLPAVALALAVASPVVAASGGDVFRTTAPGVGVVSTWDSTGSGFLVAPGRMLTAAHVVGDAGTVQVVIDGAQVDADVELTNHRLDVAVLVLSQDAGQVLELRDDPPDAGDEVFAVGAARGDMSITRGIVSRVRTAGDPPHLQTDAAVNPGNSGGPLVDASGRVVGLVVSKVRDSEGMALAVPTDELAAFVDGTAEGDAPVAAGGAERDTWRQPVHPLWALLLPAAGALYLARSRRRAPEREPDIVLGPVRHTGEAADTSNPRSGVLS